MNGINTQNLIKERRRKKREKFFIGVKLFSPDLDSPLEGVTYDISETGIRIVTSKKIKPGKKYTLLIGNAKLESLVIYEEVRGSSMMDRNVAFYYGMKFEKIISAEMKRKLLEQGKDIFAKSR